MNDYAGKWWISQNDEWFSNGPFDSKEAAICKD